MIDHIKVESLGYFYPELSGGKEFDRSQDFEKFGILFSRQHNRNGNYAYHVGSFGNLLVKINGRSVSIENSLHKFYHGNNYSNFTHSEINNAIEMIEEQFKIPSADFKIKSLEVGINIGYSSQLFEFCKLYIMDEFDKMRKGNKVYGKKVYKSEYDFKVYDKPLETKLNSESTLIDVFGKSIDLPEGINRIEAKFKKMRPISSIVSTLNDLKSSVNLENLGNKLVGYFDNANMRKQYDYTTLTPRQQELFFAGFERDFWKETKMNTHTRKKKRREWKKCIAIMDEALNNNPKQEFRDLMLGKINYLTSN
ncbi:hypothetical protein [Flavobacterium sp. CS20]|uniref:hypothetical protein n=1 Tax=Flavobacterium sp. CS20 TaxID=2775246 RepID=UPI001B3A5E2B|nr:hypothetical protein [Flavobacterium sp. CS20]QTY25975.1 hypothetical protein IGB25_08095 [Flavobacterium sp. CS20]